ncbi:uncharacterized protein LOC143274969 isoform X2 [Babylonia areolata]|uniref:uncharacterized protein LOC143274969 isoform X2 n=1 Tax=Babylonia areolata TaxID=304850 RepID=UPI003FD5FFC8
MGNCCGSTETAAISGDTNTTANSHSDGTRPSKQPAAAVVSTEGHNPTNIRLTSSPPHNLPPPTSSSAVPGVASAEYGLQPPIRYPGDVSGVYYQPTEGATALLTAAFLDTDDQDKRDSTAPLPSPLPSSSASAAAAAAAVAAVQNAAQDTAVETSTASSTEVTLVTEPASAVDSVTSPAPLRQQSNYEPPDVMISYSRSDGEVMQQIKEQLEAQGFKVWVDQSSIDAGADFLSKIGEAIIDAKCFICILSERAVRSKYCRDEVALAYVSNTAIFPVNLQSRDQLLPLMDTGLKLQLANYNWTALTEADAQQANIQALVSTMKAEMDDLEDPQDGPSPSPPDPAGETSPTTVTSPDSGENEAVTSPRGVSVTVIDVVAPKREAGSPVQSPVSNGGAPEFKPLRKLRERNRAMMTLHGDDVSSIMPEQFWSEQFGVVDYVPWERFTAAFLEVFRDPVHSTFSTEDQQQLLDILCRELEVDTDDRIYKYQLTAFCSVHGDVSPLWPRVQEQARESFAMREVFNMDSSVRVEAIENLGKFRSAAVIDALRDLLTDPDANVRAVATVSLSRTDANDPVTIRHILRTLSDRDRLVREAGCLALGHLKARQAISKLSHLWRNDVISHVREAAAVALRQIGGQEVEDVMRVTKVLAEEIRSLTEEKL